MASYLATLPRRWTQQYAMHAMLRPFHRQSSLRLSTSMVSTCSFDLHRSRPLGTGVSRYQSHAAIISGRLLLALAPLVRISLATFRPHKALPLLSLVPSRYASHSAQRSLISLMVIARWPFLML